MIQKTLVYKAIKFFLLGLFIFFTAVFLRFFLKADRVNADNLVFYPEFCLGGWEKPQNASGILSVPENSDSSQFSIDNSAFLGSQTASQIFCGYFPIEEREKLPNKVVVKFNWTIKQNIQNNTVIINPNTETQPNIEIKNEVPTTNEDPKNQMNTSVEESKTETPPQQNLDVETKQETTQVPVSTEPISKINSILKIISKVANAEEISGREFIEVSYSLDGIRWNSLGKVGMHNFRDYSVSIPITNWEDLKKIQIMVNIIPTVFEKPDIYLDGMSINVEYDKILSELTKESVENVASAVTSVLDTVGEKVVTIFTSMEDNSQQAKKPEVALPVIIKEKKLLFKKTGENIPTTNRLPWYSDDFKDLVKSKEINKNYSIETSGDNKSMTVSGSCFEKYFVILIWKKSSDYIDRPGSFSKNIAELCNNGSFVYDLKNLSTDIPDSNYFLMIAEEDDKNPWVPKSQLIPINISSVIEERVK